MKKARATYLRWGRDTTEGRLVAVSRTWTPDQGSELLAMRFVL